MAIIWKKTGPEYFWIKYLSMSNDLPGNGKRTEQLAYRLGAWSCAVLLLYSLATILVVAFIGGPPATVQECFDALHTNRVTGLLRLDILTVFVMPLYYVLFYSLYVALKALNDTIVSLSTVFIFVGVTLFLAAPSVFSYLQLSDAYLSARSENEKSQIWAAAQAILSTDIWNGTGPRIGGILVQLAATALSILMLRSDGFSKLTAYTGILTHGLDLLHMIVGFFSMTVANGIMGVAGVMYLLWFPLIMVSLFRMAKSNQHAESQ